MASIMVIGTGCSSGETDASAAIPAQTEAKTESRVETDAPKKTEGSMESVTIKATNYALLEQGHETFWNGVKAGFEVENPNTAIEWVTAPYGETVNQAINMTGGGDRTDMMFDEIGWVLGLADAGLTVPVADALSADYLADFYPVILGPFNIDDRPYELPMHMSPHVLYYNTGLFEQTGFDPAAPPTTYDEVLEYAEKLSKPKDSNGNSVYAFGQTTASIPVSGSSISGTIFNSGGTLLTDDGTLNVDNQGSKDATTMLKTLDEKGYNPQNAKLKDLGNLFTPRQLTMYYDQSWSLNGIQSINPDVKNFTASVKPLSGGTGKGQSILQTYYLMYADNGNAQREVRSKLTQHLVTSEVLNDYPTNIAPACPMKKDMEGSENMNPVLAGAADSAENVTTQMFAPQINDLSLELYTLAQSVAVSGKDVDAAIADPKKVAGAILEQ